MLHGFRTSSSFPLLTIDRKESKKQKGFTCFVVISSKVRHISLFFISRGLSSLGRLGILVTINVLKLNQILVLI